MFGADYSCRSLCLCVGVLLSNRFTLLVNRCKNGANTFSLTLPEKDAAISRFLFSVYPNILLTILAHTPFLIHSGSRPQSDFLAFFFLELQTPTLKFFVHIYAPKMKDVLETLWPFFCATITWSFSIGTITLPSGSNLLIFGEPSFNITIPFKESLTAGSKHNTSLLFLIFHNCNQMFTITASWRTTSFFF